MEFESEEGLVITRFIVTGGQLQITDPNGLYFVGCDFFDCNILCFGGEEEFLKMASGCRFENVTFNHLESNDE